MRKYIVGNWKMNGLNTQLSEAHAIAEFAATLSNVDVALCPPATLIAPMANELPDFVVGGQDCHAEANGAFTGSISAAMLNDAGAKLIIVGHSERREGFGETDEMVRAKATAAMSADLDVILCVGEPRPVREAGEAEAYVLGQLDGSLPDIGEGCALAIAYEPIWAIGTGLTPTPQNVETMHAAIRSKLMDFYGGDKGASIRLLYGGSVNSDNAAELLSVANVNGALVGGASLTAEKFNPIVAAAASIKG